jgi:hypothetical protein
MFMKKVFVKSLVQLITVCFSCSAATAQKTINVDSSYSLPTKANAFFMSDGQPYVNVKFTRVVQGSPFFIDRWNKGYIFTSEGNKLRDITLRLNLADQQLHYLKDGIEYVTEQPLNEVLIDDEQTGKLYVFRSGFPAVQYATNKTLFQALAEGEALLLKHIRKVISESTPFGSATTQQIIRNSDTYYISKKGAMIKVKKDKADLLNALGNKREKLEAFIEQHKIKFKTEEDLVQVVNYYNSI